MKRNLIKRAASAAADAVSMVSSFEMISGNDLLIHGAKKVIEYGNDRIVLRLCDLRLSVSGSNLTMKSYYDGTVRICGEIRTVSFEDKRS